MSKTYTSVQLLLLILTGIFIAGSAWYIVGQKYSSEKVRDTYLAHIEILEIKPSSKGARSVIKFNLTGTQPASGEVATLGLVSPKTAHSIDITKKVQFGINEIDLNIDAQGVVGGLYALRLIYSVPGGNLADTTVAAFSESFEIK